MLKRMKKTQRSFTSKKRNVFQMNKRGEDTDSRSLIIGFILIAAVAVIVYLFVFGTFGKVEAVTKVINLQSSTISVNCNQLLQTVNPLGLCTVPMDLGDKRFVSCAFAAREVQTIKLDIPATCKEDDGAKAICRELRISKKDYGDGSKYEVNGKKCSVWFAPYVWKSEAQCTTDKGTVISSGEEYEKNCVPIQSTSTDESDVCCKTTA